MIINTVLIGSYIIVLLERAYSKSLHHSFHQLFHSFLIFIMLYITFILFNKETDKKDFEKNVIDRQINKITNELNITTNIKRIGDFPENTYEKRKSLLTKSKLIIAISIIVILSVVFYITNLYTKSINFGHLKTYFISIFILTSVEYAFNFLIKQHSFDSKKLNVISNNFLGNMEKYSTRAD